MTIGTVFLRGQNEIFHDKSFHRFLLKSGGGFVTNALCPSGRRVTEADGGPPAYPHNVLPHLRMITTSTTANPNMIIPKTKSFILILRL